MLAKLKRFGRIRDLRPAVMRPDETRRVEGIVTAQLPSGLYHVQVDGEHRLTAHPTGSVERNFVRLLVGDRVIVELMERDGTRGRIIRKA
jgi:translation initiation factor IF-1